MPDTCRTGAHHRATGSPAELDDRTLEALGRIALDGCGIELGPSRRMMLASRLTRRQKALGLVGDHAGYLRRLESDPDELAPFLDAITTNLTYFFREPHHFDWLRADLFPRLAEARHGGPVRIWSAGCSSGQEPYSLAIVAHESGLVARRRVRILATDIHSGLVPAVAAGRFDAASMRGLSVDRHARWFAEDATGTVTAARALRELIIARRLNLFDAWPVRHGVDLIVCRNTLIYFDAVRRRQILDRFAALQERGACLMVGHSESLRDHPAYERVENTVYSRR